MSQDTLSQVLRSIRLRGAVFYHVEGNDRWVSESPPARAIAALIMPGIEHVMAYHVLTQGSCWTMVVGQAPVQLQAGDVVMFPHGDRHVISSEPGLRGEVDMRPYGLPRPEQLPFFASRRGAALSMSRLDPSSDRHGATLVCGFFGCDAHPFNPLLASLPQLLHVPAGPADDDDWIAHFIRFALSESTLKRPGGEALLERLSETMFVALVRRYLDDLPEGPPTWLAGLLRHSSAPIASIALEVGYESESAFSRAFRREVGQPPAAWRRQRARLGAGAA